MDRVTKRGVSPSTKAFWLSICSFFTEEFWLMDCSFLTDEAGLSVCSFLTEEVKLSICSLRSSLLTGLEAWKFSKEGLQLEEIRRSTGRRVREG